MHARALPSSLNHDQMKKHFTLDGVLEFLMQFTAHWLDIQFEVRARGGALFRCAVRLRERMFFSCRWCLKQTFGRSTSTATVCTRKEVRSRCCARTRDC